MSADDFPTREQNAALERLSVNRGGESARVTERPFDLPTDYIMVVFEPSNFTCGISPDGDVSS